MALPVIQCCVTLPPKCVTLSLTVSPRHSPGGPQSPQPLRVHGPPHKGVTVPLDQEEGHSPQQTWTGQRDRGTLVPGMNTCSQTETHTATTHEHNQQTHTYYTQTHSNTHTTRTCTYVGEGEGWGGGGEGGGMERRRRRRRVVGSQIRVRKKRSCRRTILSETKLTREVAKGAYRERGK